MPIAARRAQSLLTRRIREYGCATSVNGAATMLDGTPLKAVWAPAEIGRVQSYLQEEEWRASPQDVVLPIAALEPPFSLANGSALVRLGLGWTAVARRVEPCGPGDKGAGVLVLAVLTQRG